MANLAWFTAKPAPPEISFSPISLLHNKKAV